MIKYFTTSFFVCTVLFTSAQNNKTKPNIIYILADDLGIGDISAYGADNNKTPIIDKMAKEGMLFKHSYTAPLCGPSRVMILTGRYAFRTGGVNQDMVGRIKPENEVLTPGVLKAVGYTTSMIGKWSQFSLTPKDFGFDDYVTFRGSGVYWSKENKKTSTYFINDAEKPLEKNVYMPDLMHNHLVNFIAKNKNKPFYIHYAMVHVHADIQPTPDTKAGSDIYADNTAYMDKLVGKLLHALDSLKLRENTLIVFMGDNGTASKYAERGTIGGKQLSGKKGSMLECGSLVPTIANWPGKIAAGNINNNLIDASDILPTFAELAGAPLPANKVIDGKSFLPQLLSKSSNPREWIFMELGNKWYVRDAKWKLTRENELFDMSNAPFEEKLMANYSNNAEATAAYKRLKIAMDKLNPAGGILDDADGSGRHGSNVEKQKKEKEGKKKKTDNDE
ncbi:sulfatase-like hydrolase/transferase [Ferruginibacter sp.]